MGGRPRADRRDGRILTPTAGHGRSARRIQPLRRGFVDVSSDSELTGRSPVLSLDLKKVAEFARGAQTEDLLDRVTVFRDQMEPAALEVIEAELDRRGVTPEDIDRHTIDREAAGIVTRDGTAMRCSFCDRPAVDRRWGWHRLWGLVPVFPRRIARCEVHRG